jgi:photosystem II stability/assembly factor-like uncharacterized protein
MCVNVICQIVCFSPTEVIKTIRPNSYNNTMLNSQSKTLEISVSKHTGLYGSIIRTSHHGPCRDVPIPRPRPKAVPP